MAITIFAIHINIVIDEIRTIGGINLWTLKLNDDLSLEENTFLKEILAKHNNEITITDMKEQITQIKKEQQTCKKDLSESDTSAIVNNATNIYGEEVLLDNQNISEFLLN